MGSSLALVTVLGQRGEDLDLFVDHLAHAVGHVVAVAAVVNDALNAVTVELAAARWRRSMATPT